MYLMRYEEKSSNEALDIMYKRNWMEQACAILMQRTLCVSTRHGNNTVTYISQIAMASFRWTVKVTLFSQIYTVYSPLKVYSIII